MVKKLILTGFTLLFLGLLAGEVKAKYGQRWMVEYGCRGKGCVRATYIPKKDVRFNHNTDKWYTIAGVEFYPRYTTTNIINGDLPPGEFGAVFCDQGDGDDCAREYGTTGKWVWKEEATNPRIYGYQKTLIGTSGHGGPYVYEIFVPSYYYNQARDGDGGGGGGGTPTIVWVTATPTPTPTPTAAPGPWIKLKDASFVSGERIQSYIPASPVAYDADDTNEAFFIVGDDGAVTAESVALKMPQKTVV